MLGNTKRYILAASSAGAFYCTVWELPNMLLTFGLGAARMTEWVLMARDTSMFLLMSVLFAVVYGLLPMLMVRFLLKWRTAGRLPLDLLRGAAMALLPYGLAVAALPLGRNQFDSYDYILPALVASAASGAVAGLVWWRTGERKLLEVR